MDLTEFKERLILVKKTLEENRRPETLRIAFNLLDAVKARIQGGGISYSLVPFPPYSKQYAKKRAKDGYQADYVDFTRTGRLWANIVPMVIEDGNGITIVEIAARAPELQDILNWQANKPMATPRGNILLPSKDEEAFLRAAHIKRIQEALKPLLE